MNILSFSFTRISAFRGSSKWVQLMKQSVSHDRTILCKQHRTKLLIGFVPLISLPCIRAQEKPCLQETVSTTESNRHLSDTEEKEENDGWKRVRAVFELDEFGNSSKELTATIHAASMSFFFGLLYGGISRGREALNDFMERNQATAFENHLDAKKRLQNHVTIHFANGAWRWGLKLSAFTGGFVLFLTCASAYRGESTVIDYMMSGGLVGGILRFRVGPPAMLIGAVTGAILGLFCGLTTKGLLDFNNSNLDEVLAFQYEMQRSRKQLFQENLSMGNEKSVLSPDIKEIMKAKEEIKEKDF